MQYNVKAEQQMRNKHCTLYAQCNFNAYQKSNCQCEHKRLAQYNAQKRPKRKPTDITWKKETISYILQSTTIKQSS